MLRQPGWGKKMNRLLIGRFSWPLVTLGALLAVACLASTRYINRLQSDLARAVRHDVARMDAADELQVQLRHLRFHALVYAADPSDSRRALIQSDFAGLASALDTIRRDVPSEDAELLRTVEHDYTAYKERVGPGGFPTHVPNVAELVRWSDARPMRELLAQCRELSDRQRVRMDASLEQSEAQTAWAGRVLLALGIVGAFGGILSGYATARGLNRRAAQLSVRVQAVQAQLDQEVGAMTVELPQHFDDLDAQLDRVVGRVKEVCQRLQEQERDLLRAEQLAAVGQLAAGVAHEIRNPLTGIKFLVEGALRPRNSTQLCIEDLQLVRHEIVRIERTIQGLLDFARTPPPNRHRQDLRDLVAEAAGVARGRAEAKPVTLRVQGHQDPIPAAVDHDQMISLFTNLLFNAIDAAPPGGEVGIQIVPGTSCILVEVTDTGPGIDPTFTNRLFTPFVTTKPTGTGLGLTIARQVAKDHGGTLTATNRPAGGACFTLTLPGWEESDVEAARRR